MIYIKSFLFLILFLYCTTVQGQNTSISDYSKLTPEDYKNITLPSLDLLFENARNTPTYELATVKEEVERKLLAKEKRAILGFFSLRGSYQYGMFGNESTFTDVATYPYLTYSTQAQNGYTVGAAISIPLDQLFDLKPRIKRQKLNLKKAELEKEIQYDELKKSIIELYSMASSQLSIMKLRSENLVLATIQYEISERNFANGTIESSDLATDKERQSQARESFEKSKLELTRSLMILEVITRTSIISK